MDAQLFQKAVGLADLCELLAATFAFPTQELANALVDGAYQTDARACCRDAGLGDEETPEVSLSWEGADAGKLFEAMRVSYSLMYLAPGSEVPVFPYESAFRHRAQDAPGSPVLFRSPITQDVERQMRAFGVVPPNARTEPVDSVWSEFEFLSYAFGRLAEALHGGDEERAAECRGALARFWGEHGAKWLLAFMDATIAVSASLDEPAWIDPYQRLAAFGRTACRAIGENIVAFQM